MKKLVFAFIMFFTMFVQAESPQKVYDFFQKTEYKNVAREIVALAVLETGWFRSKYHNDFHNYFSIKQFNKKKQHPKCKKSPIYCMRMYKSSKEGLEDILRYFRKKNYPTDRKGFLERLNGKTGPKYAEDPKHVKKVKIIVKMLDKKGVLDEKING